MTNGIIFGLTNLTNLYLFLIILRIFLTWIPGIKWETQPWYTLKAVVDPYLALFRKFIPPVGGLDFFFFIAIIVLQLLLNVIILLLLRIS